MRWIVLLLLLLASGCVAPATPPASRVLFEPTRIALQPVFTQIKDWNSDGKPDGIEVFVELSDSFGDPTKAQGDLVFELFAFRPNNPDPRGGRVLNPWQGSLQTSDDQKAHYDRTSQCYSFQLAFPKIKKDGSYVLAASFTPEHGNRLFTQTILGKDTRGQ